MLRCCFEQTRSQLWSEVAEKITIAVQQIIEFAKMLPGFMDLSQDDQIMLLKAGKGVDPGIYLLSLVYSRGGSRGFHVVKCR